MICSVCEEKEEIKTIPTPEGDILLCPKCITNYIIYIAKDAGDFEADLVHLDTNYYMLN